MNAGRRFTDAEILEMRERYEAGGVLQHELADEFGANISTINSILTGRNYADVLPGAQPAPEQTPWPKPSFLLEATAAPWKDRANCIGVSLELFFPERGVNTREAKAVCAGCEVRFECLDAALERGERFGIWGGRSERERRKMRRSARKAASG